jgi:hypothetical protein
VIYFQARSILFHGVDFPAKKGKDSVTGLDEVSYIGSSSDLQETEVLGNTRMDNQTEWGGGNDY